MGFFKKQKLECQGSISTYSNTTTTEYYDDYDEEFGERIVLTLLESLIAVMILR